MHTSGTRYGDSPWLFRLAGAVSPHVQSILQSISSTELSSAILAGKDASNQGAPAVLVERHDMIETLASIHNHLGVTNTCERPSPALVTSLTAEFRSPLSVPC